MRYKRKLLLLLSVILLGTAVQWFIPRNVQLAEWYARYIFRPFQSFRQLVFGRIPVSIGDILYVLAGLIIVALAIRWIYFLIRFKSHKHYLGQSFLNTIITVTIAYIVFFAGYGGNYYKPSLAEHWALSIPATTNDSAVLVSYDHFLINKLNALSGQYSAIPFKQVDKHAQDYYRAFTNSSTRMYGLGCKPSVFGYFMQYLGIQGYYNPFTGEAQVNRFLPSFMLPFVVCHEMAHQSGIAAEDDANLLSYAVCTRSPDKNFIYSGYFNLWLYTHSRLRKIDSTVANGLLATLNDVSRSQLDTLRSIRRQYHSEISTYSSGLYDSYLRMHNQKDGIESYYRVALTAWIWEKQKAKIAGLIDIP